MNQAMGQPMNQAMGQPMNQAMGQPMNPAMGQPMNQAMGQPMNQAMDQPMNQAMGQPMNPAMGQPMNPAMGQPMNPAMGQPMNPAMGQPMNPAMGQPMNQAMGQPMNPAMGQPMNQAMGQPMDSAISQSSLKIVGLVGSVLVLLSPFFTWMWRGNGQFIKQTANIFNVEKGIYTFTGILLLLAAVFFILWQCSEFIPAVENIKNDIKIPFLEIMVAAVVLLFVILCFINGDVRIDIKFCKSIGEKAGHGFGPLCAFIGLIASAVPAVFRDFLNK